MQGSPKMSQQMPESKELELIGKVELKIALADTPAKLEKNLDIFLAPILLKLASPYDTVRKQVFEILKNVLSRLSSLSSVKLPIEKLITQAKTIERIINVEKIDPTFINNVRLYSLLLASKGIDRCTDSTQLKLLLLILMNGISDLNTMTSARIFHIICKILLKWEPPLKGTADEESTRLFFEFDNNKDLFFLLDHFTKFFLLKPAKPDPQSGIIPRGYTCPGLSSNDVSFFTYSAGVSFTNEQMIRFKQAVFKFVTNGFVEDDQILVKFLCVVSTDSTSLSDDAVQFLKRLQIPYEEPDFINYLISLYTGNTTKGIPPVKPDLQCKILSMLNNSVFATEDSERVLSICSIGLHSKDTNLRSLCLNFIRHVAKFNYKSLLPTSNNNDDFPINIAALIRNNLHTEGWPKLQLGASTTAFNTAVQQRRLQYETLGDILSHDYSLVEDLSYIEYFFDSLKGDLNEFLQSIQEALLSCIQHMHKLPEPSKLKLRKIIRQNLSDDTELLENETNASIATNEKKLKIDKLMAIRFISVKFANVAFDFNDSEARLFNIWGTSRINRFDIIEESTKGLNPYWFRLNRSSIFKNAKKVISTKQLLGSDVEEIKLPSFASLVNLLLTEIQVQKDQPNSALRNSLNTAILFVKQSLISEAIYGKSTTVIQDDNWSLRIEKCLEVDDVIRDLVIGLCSNINDKWYIDFLVLIVSEFLKKNVDACPPFFKYNDTVFGRFSLTLLQFSNQSVLSNIQILNPPLLDFLQASSVADNKELKIAANIMGIISTSCDENNKYLSSMLDVFRRDEVMDMPFNVLFPLAYIFSRLKLVKKDQLYQPADIEKLIAAIYLSIDNILHKSLALEALNQLLKFGVFNELSKMKRNEFIHNIKEKLAKNLKNNEELVQTWGYLSLYQQDQDSLEDYFKAVFDTYTSKQTEYIFTTGEVFSVMAGGWYSDFLIKQCDVLEANLKSLQDNFPASNVVFLLDKILVACDTTIPKLKKAACIWLLSLTQYLKGIDYIGQQAKNIHFKFMKMLTVNDDIVQDSASRGLSLIYEQGNVDLQEEMVKGLLRSFTDSSKTENLSSGTVSEETELFEPGLMNTGDGSISTYKDIMNLASEVGDPALVYQFMSIAKSSSLWSSRKGIAFGLGAIMSRSSLKKTLLENSTIARKLIPILFRYRFDPFTAVSRSMNDIWSTLVGDSTVIVSAYFTDILSELLKGMSNKEWRVRQASTSGLNQLVQTQPIEKFSETTLELWTMGFRVMDDIKDSVREEGTKIMKNLSKMLVRSFDKDSSGSREINADTILETILPFLLGTKGLESDAEDVRNFALTTLIELVKKAGSRISSFSPQLLYEFCLLFSTLEPQVINYITLNSKNFNVDSDLIDNQRKNAVTASPLFEIVEMLITRSEDSQLGEMVDACSKSIKRSVGLPSKIVSSHIVILLLKRFITDIKPFTGKLLKACFNMFDDRNPAVNLSFAQAVGYLFKATSLEKAIKYSNKLAEKYFQPTKDNSKETIGHAVNYISKYSHEQFDNVAAILMPVVFIASNDTDERLCKLYSNIWAENSTSGSGTVKVYLGELVHILSTHVRSSDFTIRKICAISIIKICDSVDNTMVEKQAISLLKLTIDSLFGRTWDGKELLFKALVNSSIKFKNVILKDDNKEILTNVYDTIQNEVRKNNLHYVKLIIIDYARFLNELRTNDDTSIDEYIELVMKLFDFFKTDNSNKELEISTNEAASGNDLKRQKPNTAINVKSSEANVANEEFVIKLLNATVPIYRSTHSVKLYKFMAKQILELFHTVIFIFTWRSQLGACELMIQLLDDTEPIDKNSVIELWGNIYEIASQKEVILNVKLKLIKLGALIIQKFPECKMDVHKQFKDLMQIDPNPRIIFEMKNLKISL